MSYFDIALVVVLAGFIFNGLSKGLIRLLGNIVGLIVGAFIASRFYLQFYEWSQHFLAAEKAWARLFLSS